MRLGRWLTSLLVCLAFLLGAVAPAGAAAPVVAAVGDIGCTYGLHPDGRQSALISSEGVPAGPWACQQAATAELVAQAGDYSAVLALGDLLAPDASLTDFETSYELSWGAFKSMTLPAVGNHEYSGGRADGYFDYFNGPDAETGRAGERGRGWHSIRLGRWLVIGLNSNCRWVRCDGRSRQVRWLRKELRANRAALRREELVRAARERRRQARKQGRRKFNRPLPSMPEVRGSTCILGFWHHPRFSSGRHGDSQDVGPFWRLLHRFGADVVLNGHDHLYERFVPMAPSGAADPTGITQFTVGTGGRSLFSFVGDPHPQSAVRIENRFGILRLRLLPQGFRWNLVATNREVLDYGSGRC